MNNNVAQPILANPVLVGFNSQPVQPVQNPVGTFTTTVSGLGVQVQITSGTALPATSVVLYRSYDKDFAHASQLNAWSGPLTQGQALSFMDSNPTTLAAAVAYYFLQVVYGAGVSQQTQQVGPVVAYINAVAIVIPQVEALSLSITAGTKGSLTLACSFEQPGGSALAVQLMAKGYLGVNSWQSVASSTSDPFLVNLQATGESVLFTLLSVNSQGIMSTTGPSVQLALVNTTTVPAIIYNSSAVALASSVQINFSAGAETTITAYKVYRSLAGKGFGAGSLIGTINSTGVAQYVFVDASGTTAYEYYVVAVNPAGMGGAPPAILPSVTNSSATQGAGAQASPVTTTSGTGLTIVSCNLTAQGAGYYIVPKPTFSASSLSGGRAAKAYCTIDGQGHVNAVIMTDGGLYATTDKPTVTVAY